MCTFYSSCGLFVFLHLILYQSKVLLLSLYHLLGVVFFFFFLVSTKSSETRKKEEKMNYLSFSFFYFI